MPLLKMTPDEFLKEMKNHLVFEDMEIFDGFYEDTKFIRLGDF